MKYTPSDLKESVDILTVCEWLDIPVSIKGKHKYILCPAHNDRHFGSCVIKDNRFTCYSCNTSGDIFELVMHAQKCDFKEACKWLSDRLGGEVEWERKSRIKPLDEETLTTIFLSSTPNPIYVTESFVSEEEYMDLDEKGDIKFFQDDTSDICVYAKRKMILYNPLLDLCRNDEEAYMELIYEKSCEALKKYEILLEFIKNKDASRVDYSYISPSQLYACLKILDTIGYVELTEFLTAKLNRCKDLIVEFSSNKPIHNNNSNRIFGKLKSGVSM